MEQQLITPPPTVSQIPASPLICPTCHVEIRLTDYFCYNCGKALQEKPKSVSITTQLAIYLGSLFLPPMGIIWGFRYLRQPGQTQKIVGSVAIILTIVSLIATAFYLVSIVNMVNQQIEAQMSKSMGF